jgi:hypothetical protein
MFNLISYAYDGCVTLLDKTFESFDDAVIFLRTFAKPLESYPDSNTVVMDLGGGDKDVFFIVPIKQLAPYEQGMECSWISLS